MASLRAVAVLAWGLSIRAALGALYRRDAEDARGAVGGRLGARADQAPAELQSITDQTQERTMYLRLAETLSAFLARLRVAADTLDILERQRLVRLLIKEVLVGDD